MVVQPPVVGVMMMSAQLLQERKGPTAACAARVTELRRRAFAGCLLASWPRPAAWAVLVVRGNIGPMAPRRQLGKQIGTHDHNSLPRAYLMLGGEADIRHWAHYNNHQWLLAQQQQFGALTRRSRHCRGCRLAGLCSATSARGSPYTQGSRTTVARVADSILLRDVHQGSTQ